MPHQIKTLLHREGWPLAVSCGLVYLGFAIQLLGILMAFDLLPLLRQAPLMWHYVGEFGFNLSTLSPLLALFALHILKSPVAYESSPGRRQMAWMVVGSALFVSMIEFYWSWNGHAEWLRGYLG